MNDKIDQNTNFAKLPSAKCHFFGKTVNFVIQKLKSKHLVCLSFLQWQVFLREREEIFYTYSGPIYVFAFINSINFEVKNLHSNVIKEIKKWMNEKKLQNCVSYAFFFFLDLLINWPWHHILNVKEKKEWRQADY